MYSFESIDLGTYRGDDYFLLGFVEPEPFEGEDYDPDEDAENYGVTLVREGTYPLEENVEIVRMDTAHGRPHMDLVYLPDDADEDRKVWLEDGYTYERMKRYLLVHWETFADRYIRYNE
ncbi:DUF7718 family protein [Halomarina pelagica]|uniref:DUF7718 family protein n=1 Tax=Halomarina pelagica TaxID=2961599 RepID=UPI0020C4FE88|nr:hypothetical protein [Halomarina sp. BND7]